MNNLIDTEENREKAIDALIRFQYMKWVDSLPKNHQQNLKESFIRNESVTFNAFAYAYKLGYERCNEEVAACLV